MSKLAFLNVATTRRSLLEYSGKIGVGTALLSTLGSLPFSKKALAQEVSAHTESQFKHSACLVNCGSRCALRVRVENDRIVQVEPEIPLNENELGTHQIRPCLRGRSSRFRVYNPDRLKYPMKRVGKRGEGKFERISWDEATKYIADELVRIREKYGNESIYYQYATGAYYHTQGRPAWQRLLNLAGGYLQYFNSYSTAQITTATPYTYGLYEASMFTQVAHSDLVVLFGLNLSETRMSGGGQVEELRRSLEKSHAKVIVIDPRYTDSAIVEHAEWIPIRPTADAALVAGLVHTMIKEDLVDDETVDRYAVGYTQASLPASAKPNAGYKDYVLGKGPDGVEKTAQWASNITGIPVTRIIQLAREIASAKAAYICQGWGPQRHGNGEQTARAIQILPIIANQFGRLGTNNGNWPQGENYKVPYMPTGTNPVQVKIPVYTWTDAIAHPEIITPKTHHLQGAEKLNHGIKMIINQAGNVLANQHGELNRTRAILEDDTLCETIVVIDNHMTATAKFADILLPETTYLEASDLVGNSYATGAHQYMISMENTITPMWECRSTYDVCADIARHLGVEEAFTLGRTQAQWVEYHYEQVRKERPHLPPFAKVRGTGVVEQFISPNSEVPVMNEFYADPKAHPLTTPSGKVEIYSAALQELQDSWILPEGDKIAAIPEFLVVPDTPWDTELAKKFPLQLCGFHTKGHAHSTYASVAVLQEAVPNQVWINPIDAMERGIHNNDLVKVFNDRGTVMIEAKVTHRVLPGVASMPEGAWSVVKNGVDIGGCINSITSHRITPLAKGNPQHTNLVEIARA